MKLTDYVANVISQQGVREVFVLQGGAALHLIDSIEKHPELDSIAMQHEQASAMAADSYAKCNGSIGVTISTSGPGATNLLTGIACSYFDSIPTLHITGNVASFRQSDDFGVRQYGFQETDIVSMAKPITKYAVRISNPSEIIPELTKAISIAKSGRPGPVLVDIPDNFQRELLDLESSLTSASEKVTTEASNKVSNKDYDELLTAIEQSQRPVFVLGAGIIAADSVELALEASKYFNIPYVSTWPLKGIADHDEPLNLGSFGTHSYRGNNIVLQNADLIVSIGSRLDSRATAKLDTFARDAKIAMVDIDATEINKFSALGKHIDYTFAQDCKAFLTNLSQLRESRTENNPRTSWFEYIVQTREKFNYKPEYQLPLIDPYLAIEEITSSFGSDEYITVDTGTCLPLTLVYGKEKKGQKYISSYNNTPMGYALPAAIGAALSSNKPITCISGDGGLQMNIQELATLQKLQLPVTNIVFNNSGHCMIKQTQDDWLDSNYFAADSQFGLPEVNFAAVAQGYGISATRVTCLDELKEAISTIDRTKPSLIEIMVAPDFRCEPIIKYGNPLENMSPTLAPDVIESSMIIDVFKG